MRQTKRFCTCILAVLVLAVSGFAKTEVTKSSAGKLPNGADVDQYTLKDEKIEVRILTYGGYIAALRVPDRSGKLEDVVLGFDDPTGYYENMHSSKGSSFGPIIGRYANRIAHAQFTLDGKTYQLTKNNGENTLHGGPNGFSNQMWDAKQIKDGVELHYVSKDTEEGYPGNLSVTVRYTLDGGELKIDYRATTDKPTVVNLTNHSYFNLAGQGHGNVLHQQLKLNASRFTPVNDQLIPTGELKPVAGTPFDFTKLHAIGDQINADDEQLHRGNGYDHNFVLDGDAGKLEQAAEAYDPDSGRLLTVLTTEPGVQLYIANHLDGSSIRGKGGVGYEKNAAFCLETQHFPDSPNQPAFPSTVLRPGKEFHSVTIFRFATR